jgi:hypothetical protein
MFSTSLLCICVFIVLQIMCDGVKCGFVVHLCFNVGELIMAGWVFWLL